MPAAKAKTKRKVKRRTKRPRTQNVKIVGHSFYGMGANLGKKILPPKFSTTLRISDHLVLNQTTAGTVVSAYYRANSIYEPILGVPTSYPRGTSTFLQDLGAASPVGLYRFATVRSSRITVIPNNTQGNLVGLFAIMKKQTNTLPLNYDDLFEETYTNWKLIPNQRVGCELVTMQDKLNVSTFLGVKPLLSNTAVRHQYSSPPAKQCFWQLAWHAQDPTQFMGEVHCTVIIDYDVTFTEPISPDQ